MKDPVENSPGDFAQAESAAHYKQKYKALKRKLRLLIYEQECFLGELKSTQKKLLKVSRDKSYLLDRLLQLEKLDGSSSDSDATASSDSDTDHNRTSVKRKRTISFAELPSMNDAAAALLADIAATSTKNTTGTTTTTTNAQATVKEENGPAQKKRPKTTKKERSRKKATEPSLYTGMLSREEIERQLDLKKPVMGIEKAQATLPMEIFSNENSMHPIELINDVK